MVHVRIQGAGPCSSARRRAEVSMTTATHRSAITACRWSDRPSKACSLPRGSTRSCIRRRPAGPPCSPPRPTPRPKPHCIGDEHRQSDGFSGPDRARGIYRRRPSRGCLLPRPRLRRAKAFAPRLQLRARHTRTPPAGAHARARGGIDFSGELTPLRTACRNDPAGCLCCKRDKAVAMAASPQLDGVIGRPACG
jgi:hypothetical protein